MCFSEYGFNYEDANGDMMCQDDFDYGGHDEGNLYYTDYGEE